MPVNTQMDSMLAPSAFGSFLRSRTFEHVRQLDAIASRSLLVLAGLALLLPSTTPSDDGDPGHVLVDADDTIIEAHGHTKQGAGFGYSGVRGLNALLGTFTIAGAAPIVVVLIGLLRLERPRSVHA